MIDDSLRSMKHVIILQAMAVRTYIVIHAEGGTLLYDGLGLN